MMLSWLRLLRAPNLPSAATNVLAGAAMASALTGTALDAVVSALACLCSIGIYACGLVWNDLADHEFDRQTRPERPLPRGEISRRAAWTASVCLLAISSGCAFFLPENARMIFLAIAVLSFLYNFALKASPLLGPLALGGCRALNMIAGMMLVVTTASKPIDLSFLLLVAVHVFAYIATLSSFARMEDSVVARLQARIELFVIALIVASLGLRLTLSLPIHEDWPRACASALPLLGLMGFAFVRSYSWNSLRQEDARSTVVWLLAGIYAIDAALASWAWGALGLVLLLPLPLAVYLRKRISAS